MIKVIDLHFLGYPHTIAAYLMESSDGPILFETGPHSTFEHLKAGLERHGYQLADLKHVFITHIHLDHAGAAWALAEHGADVYLHPFGQRHMNDPSKLISSATRIYGDDMDRLWGTLKGIPADQLRVVKHEEIITIGDKEIKAWHTPGHAVHHIAWQINDQLIAGDVAGVRIGKGPVVPPCPPPDINIEDWQDSLNLIRLINPHKIYLSHYGPVEKAKISEHLDKLESRLLDWANWIKPHYEGGTKPEGVVPVFQEYVRNQLKAEGLSEEEITIYENANPSGMSVAGLMRYWRKKESS